MKKLFALILVVLLVLPVLPASALTEVPAFLYEGTWTNTAALTDGVSLTTICLEEYGTAYYVTQMFLHDEIRSGRSFIGSWEITGPNSTHVTIGENTSMDMVYSTFNMMFDTETLSMFFRAEMRDGDMIK